ncbi:MAG: glycerate kinase [Actinomycetota bacterium]|nr:glycerate kinase [Actinomycetota bacterium]
MRVLLAPDSFGGTLSAVEAAAAMAAGWAAAAPGDQLEQVPVSDGGPGFLGVLSSTLAGVPMAARVQDPLGRPVAASVLMVGDTAYVESAQACGLHHLSPQERDPLRTSTYGVGELLRTALSGGARRIVVGLGGSGTNDGGAGALTALGLRHLDEAGVELEPGGAALARLDRTDRSELDPRLASVELVLASDVDNPLLGPVGASAVFGPQKGASAAGVGALDAALGRFATVHQRDGALGFDLASEPGAGAAGGLGAGLMVLGGHRVAGIATVLRALGLAARVATADLVVTGEGSFDWQSLRGKVVSGVAAAAMEQGVPCLVIAGQVAVGRREMGAAGVSAAYAVADAAGSVEAALARPAEELAALAAQVAREWSRPS